MTNLKDILWIIVTVLGIISTVGGFGFFVFKAGQAEAMRHNGYVSDARFKETLRGLVSRDACDGHVIKIETDLSELKETQVRMCSRQDKMAEGIARIEGMLG